MNSRTSGIHSEMSTRHSHGTDLSGPADPFQLVKKEYLVCSWEHGLLCNSVFKKERYAQCNPFFSNTETTSKLRDMNSVHHINETILIPCSLWHLSPVPPDIHCMAQSSPDLCTSLPGTEHVAHSIPTTLPPAVLDSNALSTLNFLCYFGRLNLSPMSGLTHWAWCRTVLQSEEEGALLLLSLGAGSSSSLEMLIILATFCGGVSEKTANGWWGNQQRRGNSPHFSHLCLFMLNLKNLSGRVGPESWLQNSLFGKYD